VAFRPAFEKHAGQRCFGVMIHVTSAALFRPVATYSRLIALAARQAPDRFAFRTTPYEFETQIPAIDLLTGSSEARLAIQDGASPEQVVAIVAPVPAAATEVPQAAEALLARAEPR
jgi:uncharacterized protein YbbC (DUF1343 family)